jgi:hypothetical protein
MRRLVSLDKPGCLNAIELNQLHQFFVGCSVEPTLGVEAINDMQSVKEACRSAFEGTKTAPSATQQQVSETLRHRLRVYESKQNIIYFFPLYPCEIRQDVRNSVHNWATEARLETRQSARERSDTVDSHSSSLLQNTSDKPNFLGTPTALCLQKGP